MNSRGHTLATTFFLVVVAGVVVDLAEQSENLQLPRTIALRRSLTGSIRSPSLRFSPHYCHSNLLVYRNSPERMTGSVSPFAVIPSTSMRFEPIIQST